MNNLQKNFFSFSVCLFVACFNSLAYANTAKDTGDDAAALSEAQNENKEMILVVTSTAYTSVAGETDNTPNLTAWGVTLKPGMKVIAVSRDLIKMGLGFQAKLRIDGFEGDYVVVDKMNRRWKKKIDIYMGNDRTKAKKWGKRKVTIHWTKE